MAGRVENLHDWRLPTLPPPLEHAFEVLQQTTNDGRQVATREITETLPSQVTIADWSIPSREGSQLEARAYRPLLAQGDRLPTYNRYHGGGILFGSLGSKDATCAQVALDARDPSVIIVNVDYRHTPEFAVPIAWDDADDAFAWVCQHADQIGEDNTQIVIGSLFAGGQLAAALAQTLNREQNPLRDSLVGQVLITPCLVHQYCYEQQRQKLSDSKVSSLIENELASTLPIFSYANV